MRTKEELINEGIIKIGTLYETQNDIIVVDEATVDTYDWADISKISRSNHLKIYNKDDLVKINNYYFLRDGGNYIYMDGKYINIEDIENGRFNYQEFLNYFNNHPYRAISNNIYYSLRLILRTDEYKNDGNMFSYSPFEEYYPNIHPEIWYNYLKDTYDLIFINQIEKSNRIEYSILKKKKDNTNQPDDMSILISNIISLNAVGFYSCKLLKENDINKEVPTIFALEPKNTITILKHKTCKEVYSIYSKKECVGVTAFDWEITDELIDRLKEDLNRLNFTLNY